MFSSPFSTPSSPSFPFAFFAIRLVGFKRRERNLAADKKTRKRRREREGEEEERKGRFRVDETGEDGREVAKKRVNFPRLIVANVH